MYVDEIFLIAYESEVFLIKMILRYSESNKFITREYSIEYLLLHTYFFVYVFVTKYNWQYDP